MQNLSIQTIGKLLCGAALALLLTACAGEDTAVAPEERVRERAQAWADALLAKDLDAAYAFTSPAYREFATAGHYHARVAGAPTWRGASIGKVDCTGHSCNVKLVIEHYIPQMKMVSTTPVEYRWVEVDGEWWLYVPAK